MLFKRALLHELFVTAATVFCILLGIVCAQRVTYLIQLAVGGNLPNDAISTILIFNLVRFLPMLLSLTLFLAVLLTLSRWHRDSEMIIWRGAGIGTWGILQPLLQFSSLIVTIILALSLFLMPWAYLQSERYSEQVKNRDDFSNFSPGLFKESTNRERVFFIEHFDELGETVKNIFVQSMQQHKLDVIVATSGRRVIAKNGDKFLIMNDGYRYQSEPNSATFSSTKFAEYAVRVVSGTTKPSMPSTQSLSSFNLIQYPTMRNIAELQWRMAFPISAFILALLAFPLSTFDPRAGRSVHFILAVVVYIIYNNLISIANALVTQGKITALIGIWSIHLIFLALALGLMWRSNVVWSRRRK